MKFKLLIRFSFLFIPFTSVAQLPALNWGELENSLIWKVIVGGNDEYFYVQESSMLGSESKFEVYDYKAQLVSSTDLINEYNGQKLYVAKTMKFHNKDILILAGIDKESDSCTYYSTEIKDGKVSDELIRLCSVPYKFKRLVMIKTDFGIDYQGIRLSRDKESIIIVMGYSLVDSKKENEKFTVIRINKNLEVDYQKEVEIEYADDDFTVDDVEVSSNGKLIVLGKKHKERKEIKEEKKENRADREKGEKNKIILYDFYIYTESGEGFEGEKFVLEGESVPLRSVLFPLSDGNMIMTGFYAQTNNNVIGARGTYFATLDKEGDPISKSLTPFTHDFFDAISERHFPMILKKIQKDKYKGLSVFNNIRYISLNENTKEVKFVSEVAYSYEKLIRNSDGSSSLSTRYFSGDVLITNYTLNGELAWSTRFEKKYHTNKKSFLGLLLKENEGSLYFIFNNLKSKEERKALGVKKGENPAVEICVISPTGAKERREVLYIPNKEDNRIKLLPVSSDISENGHAILRFARSMTMKKSKLATFKIW
jgi:hypothetical protein